MSAPASLRRLMLPEDYAFLERLDLSFIAQAIYVIERHQNGFVMVEQPLSPPVEKRYEVDWSELAATTCAIVAEHDGRVVAVGAIAISAWNRRATLAHLYVDRASRGVGIGTKLVEALAQEAATRGVRAVWVETQNVNVQAIRFYRARGFELCGLDTSFYDPMLSPGETAVFLLRTLAEDGRNGMSAAIGVSKR